MNGNEPTATADSSNNESTELRSVIGTIGHACTRPLESLKIDSKTVGNPDSLKAAESQPIIRIRIKQPVLEENAVRPMGTVSAHPIYNDESFEGPMTEAQLEQTLAGYQVRVELQTNEKYDTWPPFSIDYGALGFAETNDDPRGVPDFRTYTGPMPFTDAVTLVDKMVSTLRNHREQ